MTRLKFGDSTFDPNVAHIPPTGSIYSRILGGETVSVERLYERFIANNFKRLPIDALKVSKVLYMYCILFGMDMKKSLADCWV